MTSWKRLTLCPYRRVGGVSTDRQRIHLRPDVTWWFFPLLNQCRPRSPLCTTTVILDVDRCLRLDLPSPHTRRVLSSTWHFCRLSTCCLMPYVMFKKTCSLSISQGYSTLWQLDINLLVINKLILISVYVFVPLLSWAEDSGRAFSRQCNSDTAEVEGVLGPRLR